MKHIVFLIAIFFSSAMNAETPLNYFLYSYGPAARPTMLLNWIYTTIVLIVCILIAVLLLVGILRKRPDPFPHPKERSDEATRWMLIGTGISVCVLFAMAIYAFIVLNETATPPQKPDLTITVTGYDWWWKVEYHDENTGSDFITANEIHIPVGVPVQVILKSADVIHAFWVPKLAGKTEMIPGLTNQQWLQADATGIYHGKCTQFCGIQHAHMDFEVVAENPADFRHWEAMQRAPSSFNANTAAGKSIFMNRCAACHTVHGSDAKGEHGPDLTHLYSRRFIAAGMLPTTGANVMDWVQHAQEIKQGAQMPDMVLSPKEISALSAYLDTLK